MTIIEHALAALLFVVLLHVPLLLFSLIIYIVAIGKVIRRRRSGAPTPG
jgi:phage shock protein PspC (stress-responsive transcriptional regulator)